MELSENLRERLVELARQGAPNEVCGYVVGHRGEPLWASGLYPVENALMSPTAFALDGQSMIDAEKRIETDGYEILGVYHSHPTSPPEPSKRDRRDAAEYDPFGYLVHLIVSLGDGAAEIRAWAYADDQAVGLDLIDEVVK